MSSLLIDQIILGIHITGAAIWVGSTVLLGVIASAVTKALVDYKVLASRVMSQVARKASMVMWGAMGVTIATGVYNLTWFLPSLSASAIMADGALQLKMALVFFLVLVSALHSFVLGPMVRKKQESGSKGMNVVYVRIANRVASLASLVLSIAVIFAAVALAT